MEKPKQFKVKCLYLNALGQGIVKTEKGLTAVPNLLPKETAIIAVNDSYRYNKVSVVKYENLSAVRQEPRCAVYGKCGGCQLLHMTYPAQIAFKRDYVINAFKEEKIPVVINDIITAPQTQTYRNKMQIAYRLRDNAVVYGFYEEESHRVIPLENCPVQTPAQNEIARFLRQLITRMKLQPYNEEKRTGLIRFALIRESWATGQLLVTIVTNTDIFPGRSEFVKELTRRFPMIATIIQNINPRQTSVILGEQERILYGDGYITDKLCGVTFKVSAKTFFQINPVQAAALYEKVIEYANFSGGETVIDAYCGVGTIGLILSASAGRIIGVESNRQAVYYAIENMKDNKIKNAQFIAEDATEFLEKYEKTNNPIDAVIMDPPRSGSTERFLKTLLRLKPQKIIYVSCEAQTLARDVKVLRAGYRIEKMAIVDLFVGTYHIETVALMSRKDN